MKSQTSTLVAGFLLFFCVGLTNAYSQVESVKFGKIEAAELAMRSYDKDTSAAAVVLSDVGRSYFVYNKGFKLIHDRHTRIKVLKKSGYDFANVSIPYYQRNSNKESISSIKGYTYNQEGGKMVKEKLDTKAVFDEQTSENWSVKKFSMPSVKEGSIIEYSYTISSDFLFNLREWEFQNTIPVVYSDYKVRIPEYYHYKQQQQGYLGFDMSTQVSGKESFVVTWESEINPGMGGGRTSGGSTTVTADNTTYHWVVKDAPAIRPENHITTIRDYLSKIDFELQTIKYPGEMMQVVTGDWAQVTKEMLDSDRFGAQLNRKGFFKNEIAAVVAKHTGPQQQMAAVHDLVKSTVKWNGNFGIYASGPLRKAFENRTGNAADVNLILVSMLQEAGLDAAPVLLSTRSHGRAPIGSPMLHKFNYVVAHVKIDGTEYLLDATDPLLTAGMLPVRCLNGQGRLIKQEDQRWVALQPALRMTKLFNGALTIKPNGEMVGNVTESSSGYNALDLRRTILNDGEDKYAEKISREIGNFKIGKPAFTNVKDIGKSLDIKYTLTATGSSQPSDIIYFSPMMGQGETENPFKLENRVYPVDLAVPIDYTYICRFELPTGYDLDEAPQNTVVSLPEDGGRFMYVIQKEGNTVQVMSKINIMKPMFYAQDYPHLKEFYNLVVAKHAEQIVLKKVSE